MRFCALDHGRPPPSCASPACPLPSRHRLIVAACLIRPPPATYRRQLQLKEKAREWERAREWGEEGNERDRKSVWEWEWEFHPIFCLIYFYQIFITMPPSFTNSHLPLHLTTSLVPTHLTTLLTWIYIVCTWINTCTSRYSYIYTSTYSYPHHICIWNT